MEQNPVGLKEHKEKQTIDFDICKRNLILKLQKELDKSKKGSVDEPIVELVDYINQTRDFCTTSSCSGRFAIFCAAYSEERGEQISKGGKWLFVEHRTVNIDELYNKTIAELPNCKGVTLFKLEPFVLHVQCRDWEAAQSMLNLAVAAGFRESGILMGRRIMLGIRTTSNSMEFPIAENGQLLVSREYLDYVISYGNKKFEDNLRRINAFFELIKQHFPVMKQSEPNLKKPKMDYSIHTSAPGKTILLGEHSVVYHRAALCGVVDSCRIHTYIKQSNKEGMIIRTKYSSSFSIPFVHIQQHQINEMRNIINSGNIDISFLNVDVDHLTASVMRIVLYFYTLLSEKFHREINFDILVENVGIPEEKGIGGSAALCTSVASGLLLLFYDRSNCIGSQEFLDEINELAYKGEVLFHGKPSGLDNSVSCYGGLLKFQKSESGSFMMKPIQSSGISLLLIDSMLPKNTATMIKKVSDLRSTFTASVDSVFDSIQFLVNSIIDDNDCLVEDRLPQAMDINQGLLRTLGVSNKTIDTIVDIADRYDYAAKLTGGGGGGCVIAVSRGNRSDQCEAHLMDELSRAGFFVRQVVVGGRGVFMEYLK